MQNYKQYNVREVIERIQSFCAIQDRSQYEVKKKMKSWGIEEYIIDNILSDLITEKFIDEHRFANSFCRGKFRIKKWGKLKIRMALKKREVNFKCIDFAMLEIDEKTYLNTLKELLQKRNDILKETNLNKRKMKLINYLVNRGYEYDLIYDSLVELKLFS